MREEYQTVRKILAIWFSLVSAAFIAGGIFVPVVASAASAYVWTDRSTSPGLGNWWAVSSNGTAIVAIVSGGNVWSSPDNGSTWINDSGAGSRNWKGVATFNNGVGIVAAPTTGDIYVSTSSGATWTDIVSAGSQAWYTAAASSNGSVLAAAVSHGDIYVSTSTGATWTDMTQSGPMHGADWNAVTVSPDGSTIVAVVAGGGVYVSTSTGATWTLQSSLGNHTWTAAATDQSGSKIMVSYSGSGSVYMSTDGATTWAILGGLPSANWVNLAMSNNGTVLVAAISGGQIWTSIDSGTTWIDNTVPGSRLWSSLTIPSDNSTIFATAYSGDIWSATLVNQNALTPSHSADTGLPWCSGPMAPGWNVSLPGGGCGTSGGTSDTPIVPVVAPATSSVPIATPPVIAVPVPTPAKSYHFTRDLHKGMSGPDVRELQLFLNTHGFPVAASGAGSSGNESDYFGQATVAALIAFQNAHAAGILAPAGLTHGTGYFGSGTREFVSADE